MTLLYCASTRAHDPDEASLPSVEVSASRNDLLIAAPSASTGVYGAKDLHNRPILRTGEILESVPGLIVTQHSGDGKANQYFLRGFNLDHGTDFATYVDGMRVNFPSHAHGQGYTDLNFLIPELVRRVQFRKGPYFAEEGDFSSVGSARISTFRRDLKPFGLVTLGSNSFVRTVAAGSFDSKEGSLLLAGEAQYGNGTWEVAQHHRKKNALLRWSHGTDANGWSVSAMAYEASWTATDQIAQRAVDQGLISRFGSLDPSTGGRSSRYSLSGQWTRNREDSSLELNAYLIRYRLNLFSNFSYFTRGCEDTGLGGPGSSSPGSGNPVSAACNLDTTPRDQFEQQDQRTVLGLDAKYSNHHKLLGVDSETTVGTQARVDSIQSLGLYDTVAQQRTNTIQESRVRQQSLGIYTHNSSQWSSFFRTELGLRLENLNVSVNSSLPQNSGSQSANILSPKITGILGPWKQSYFYLNWGQGHHSNDARGITTTIDPKTGAAVPGTTPLVRSKGYEIGLRSSAAPDLVSTFSLWRLDLGSELLFVGDAGSTTASLPSRHTGVEWTNTWRPTKWLRVEADFAWTTPRFLGARTAGNRIPGAPEKIASVAVNVDIPGGWFGGARLRYFGSRALVQDNSVRSAGNTLVNAKLGYRFHGGTQLSLDIFNLFNRPSNDIEYFYASRLRGEAAFNSLSTPGDIHFHPAEPRTIRLNLKIPF